MDASLHKNPYSNGFDILCADCGSHFPSYDSLVTHISFTHPSSATQELACKSGEGDTSDRHPQCAHRFEGETLPTVFDAFENDKHAQKRRTTGNPAYPFLDLVEVELARWLNERLTSTQIDEFLKLKWVRRHPPSFQTCHTLRSWIEELPSGPVWRTAEITLEGYNPAPRNGNPLLIYRDGLECLEYLYGLPIFAPFCAPEPYGIHTAYGQRVITDFNTACQAWNLQNKLPRGATVLPIQFGGDKIEVTNGTGDIEMHPLLMTLAAIPSAMRSKLSNNAWICIAYLPVAKFDVHRDYNSVLANRVLHEAMDIITRSLKDAMRDGKEMADGYGNVRLVFPPIVAFSGDLPEQLSMAAVAASVSPVTLATTASFGEGHQHPPRTKAHTLDLIHQVSQKVDPWKLHDFLRECGKVGLNGVHKPWWRDYPLTDPHFLCQPDILHSDFKFFWDHVHKACQIHVGSQELDRRFNARHKRIGYAGLRRVSEVKQMTGRMYREIMRTTVVAIAGAVSPGFMLAIRSLMEFLLIAQSPRHTPTSLARMTTLLRTFHENKHAIMDAGGRGSLDHWHIPKLELLSTWVPAILSHGALPQWSCDAIEHLIRTEAKKPFAMFTNHRRSDFGTQCARHLDRLEKLRLFELYSLFTTHGIDLHNLHPTSEAGMNDVEFNDASAVGAARTWVANSLPGAERSIRGPRLSRNLFATGSLRPEDSNVAFHLTKKPTATYRVDEIARIYQLPDFHAALVDYVRGFDLDSRCGDDHWSNHSHGAGFDEVRVWDTYRIQVLSIYDDAVRLDPETLRAVPPNETYRYGMCDAVLIDSVKANGELREDVRVVFEPVPRKGNIKLPPHLQVPLVYIQDFAFNDLNEHGHPCKAAGIEMYKLRRRLYADAGGVAQRAGEVIPLTNVVRPVDIAPAHGQIMLDTVTEFTALEVPTHFWLNDLWDKELYETFVSGYE
ncbi:uncharacterized protein C8Q71DRAFT_705953 [Rhodofomes roseus]|uniref:C2H2-type domain-containing protein n=1 Tax=Rhodofomes roseus TaxID=34475 RepID=A0ABQ8KII4_9APHY|nr:uncharacterized protein C8Q71DRAFT_705953 [Rhodofomes roseus]KAH9837600.1 hypothetical protein C8Q71DRAFT_705953 [Rhodofomes roseus]